MMYYDNIGYVDARLRNTIVNTISGTPVHINNVYHDDKCNIILKILRLEDSSMSEIHLEEVDLTPVKLGYMNTSSGPVYVTRRPVRKWKQGLSLDNVVYYGPYKSWDTFPLKPLDKTIKGVYPTIKSVLSSTKQSGNAFSRDFALCSEGQLQYHGRVVGSWNGSKFQLSAGNYYLDERLVEDVGEELL